MENPPVLAVIGGSGLYTMQGLQDMQEFDLATPFGKPSAPVIVGTLEGQRVAFLARHGIGHHISPSEVNYRANIYALKTLGVERIVSISACGSLREDYIPGEIVVPDQLFDFTRQRERSFFGAGLVVHISVPIPFVTSSRNWFCKPRNKPGQLFIGAAHLSPSKGRAFPPAASRTFIAPGVCR
jgi:5'-methylthioadenosine phosphorylase